MTDKIQFLLDNFATNQYSHEFVYLIKSMLQPDPQKRFSLEQASQYLEELQARRSERPIYCIRLEADPNPSPTHQNLTLQPKRRAMLNNMTVKVSPKPISMFSSTATRPFLSSRPSTRRLGPNN